MKWLELQRSLSSTKTSEGCQRVQDCIRCLTCLVLRLYDEILKLFMVRISQLFASVHPTLVKIVGLLFRAGLLTVVYQYGMCV